MPAELTHVDITTLLTEHYRRMYLGVRAAYDASRRVYVVSGRVLAQPMIVRRAEALEIATRANRLRV